MVDLHLVMAAIRLSELVQDRPGPLGVDGRDLGHHLAVVRVRAVCQSFLVASLVSWLRWAYLARTARSLVVLLFASVRRVVLPDVVDVLVVNHSRFLQVVLQEH